MFRKPFASAPLIAFSPFWFSVPGRFLLAAALALVVTGIGLAWRMTANGYLPVAYDQPLRAEYGLPSGERLAGGSVSTASTAAGNPAAGSRPQVYLPVEYFDFGPVGPSAVVQHRFLVINRGSQPLVIERAYTTCGCAVAEISASHILPGHAAQVTVIFDAGFHNVAGKTVRRGLILETNDPERPQAEIWVQARVR